MRIVRIGIIITILGLTVSCKEESIADYVSYQDDTFNNPNGLLEDYGEPYNQGVNVAFFRNYIWTINIVTKASSTSEYQLLVELSNLKVYSPTTPNNYHFANFSSSEPYKPLNEYATNEIDFTISNGDKRLTGRWFKYGDSRRLILAKRGITLVFTKR